MGSKVSSPKKSPIGYDDLLNATTILTEGHNDAAKAILEFKEEIMGPELQEVMVLFFESSSASMEFLSDLQKKLMEVKHQIKQLMVALNSGSETMELENIRRLVEPPVNFSESLVNQLTKMHESYTHLQGRLRNLREILLAQDKTATKSSGVWGVMNKVLASISISGMVVYEMLHGIVTGNLEDLTKIVSGKSNLSTAMDYLWMDEKKRKKLMETIQAVDKQLYVGESFANIRSGDKGVKIIATQINLLVDMGRAALQYKLIENNDSGYIDIVKRMKEDTSVEDMEKLEGRVKECHENVTTARKVITEKVMMSRPNLDSA